jgi:predicted TPR repeat methyltransferase
MNEDWDEHAKIWDQDEVAHFFADQALASLLEHVNLRHADWKHRHVLDFGCGTGLLSERVAPLVANIVAVDISPSMLDVLRKKNIPNVETHGVDINDDSVRSKAPWFGDFDLIVASSVCGFLPSYALTVELLAKALNPNGCFVQWDWLLAEDGEDDDGLKISNVVAAFANAGLTCVRAERAFDIDFEGDASPVLIGVGQSSQAGV